MRPAPMRSTAPRRRADRPSGRSCDACRAAESSGARAKRPSGRCGACSRRLAPTAARRLVEDLHWARADAARPDRPPAGSCGSSRSSSSDSPGPSCSRPPRLAGRVVASSRSTPTRSATLIDALPARPGCPTRARIAEAPAATRCSPSSSPPARARPAGRRFSADHPGAAGRAARPAGARRAHRARARVGRRPRVLPRPCRRARARRAAWGGRSAPCSR